MIFIRYLRKRFPIPLVLLFSLTYILLAFGITQHNVINDIPLLLRLVCIFSFFLLRLRITDEFKDSTHDKKHYPNRPFVSGEINETQLYFLLIIACLGEFIPLIFIQTSAQIIYIAIICYSLFMTHDFFLESFFSKHFTLQFCLHELIFLLYAVFLLLACNQFLLSSLPKLTLGVSVLCIVPMCIEIIRKFSPRFNASGKHVADTYSTVWGRSITLFIVCGLLTLSGIMLTIVKNDLLYTVFGLCLTILLYLKSKQTDKFVSLFGGLTLIGYALLSNL